jgi:NtrC-family two-component system response regulator AlgB
MAKEAAPADRSGLLVLVVDDEPGIRKTLSYCLEEDGHEVISVGTARDAASEASRRAFDAAFVDVRLGSASGLDLIPVLLAESPWMKIIVITAYASVETAVQAMKLGAADYIPKPFEASQVRLAIRRASELRSLEGRIRDLSEELARWAPEVSFSTSSASMRKCLETAAQVAASDAAVLLRGESGTGKSVLARAIHHWSPRVSRPFTAVSCPSIPPELLESELFGHAKGAFTGAVQENPGRMAATEGGTLFLDEVGDLPLSLQPKLLRFLQEKEYERVGDPRTRRADIRLISASNEDLEVSVREGAFRQDLYYRLNVIEIRIPSLRERREDITALAETMLRHFCRINHRAMAGAQECRGARRHPLHRRRHRRGVASRQPRVPASGDAPGGPPAYLEHRGTAHSSRTCIDQLVDRGSPDPRHRRDHSLAPAEDVRDLAGVSDCIESLSPGFNLKCPASASFP